MLRRPVVVRRGPGLIGTMARTAVVAGTATAVVGGMNRRSANRAQAQADEQASQQQAALPAAGGQPDLTAKLKELADLRASGALSDEEFAAAKAKLLGG
ncbi:MAG TPA: SHOCT domain-containing protein [Micromonosporaceae bacterium]|jgi:hypothetical protein|nr:SHOCT domain-containing protein [Micromonosporaceae bacterium]